MNSIPQRQIHLDFHTSPYIPGVGEAFDAVDFAKTLKRAHVNSVTVFAKCHHGMCYFPTKGGTIHPGLKGRDLLGEMLTALHREGIRAPIYTTVAWEEDVADRFPAWRQMYQDGTYAQQVVRDSAGAKQPGGWRFNDWSHPDYQDYIAEHLTEICERYGREVDGFFLDILFYERMAHYSDAARALRKKGRLHGDDEGTFRRFEGLAQKEFCARFTRLIKDLRASASVFYNSGFDVVNDARVGGRVRARYVTHLEIESLPSGFWGYYHFPRLARSAGRWGLPWIGMTGRFQKMWGDFGGIKPQAALEYECFRSQALGGANSVGDQLPPRGVLDRAAYELIGSVYAQCAAVEPFYADSQALPQIGILTANHAEADSDLAKQSDEGAVQMCEETHYDVAVLDEESDLSPYALLILPDETQITAKMRPKLERYWQRGGKLIVSYHAGRDVGGSYVLDFLPLSFAEDVEKFPTYWRARKPFWPELSESDRVFYAQGTNIRPAKGLEVLVDRVLPYFKRTDLTFSSHFQTPPVADVDRHPAVVAGKQFVYFADPLFREYRRSGNIVTRDVWKRVVENLIGKAPYGADLPTTVLCVPRRRRNDLLLTLLHYVPLRKAIEIDVLEERMSFAGERLGLPTAKEAPRNFETTEPLVRQRDGSYLLPAVKGRLLLEVPHFFGRTKA